MTEEIKKEVTNEEVLKALETNVFIGELVSIMRAGEYLSVSLEPMNDEEVLFRSLTPIEKAMVILHKQSQQQGDKFKCDALSWLLWSGVRSDPDYKKANESTENRGMVIREGWKVVLLPPLTEEEEMEQMHREASKILGQILGGMESRFAASPFKRGSFSHGASPFKDIFEPEAHSGMGEDLMEEGPFEEDSSGIDHRFGIFGSFFNHRR